VQYLDVRTSEGSRLGYKAHLAESLYTNEFRADMQEIAVSA
jgi:hypothetical protein